MKKLTFALLSAFLLCQITVRSHADDLNTIIVTSSRIPEVKLEVGNAITVISKDEIEASGYSSVADLLRITPSIGVSKAGGQGTPTSLRIRGEEGYRTLVMLDGVDLSDPTGTQVGPKLEHMLLNGDVEQIEILRGSQGFIYGADAGGVINIFTPRGDGPLKGQLKLEGGRYSTEKYSANISSGNEKADFFLSVADYKSEGFNSRVSDTSRDRDGYDNKTIHTKLGFLPNAQSRLQLVVRDIESENEYDNCFTPSFSSSNDCLNFFDQLTSKLSYEYKGEGFSQNIAYAITEMDRESLSENATTFATDGEITRAEYWGSININDATLVYGADLEEEDIETNSGDNLSRDQLGLFAEYKTDFNDILFANLGIRQDDNDDFGKHVSKRASFSYVPVNSAERTLKYRASYGTGFRAPSLSEVAYNNGGAAFPPASNVELKEETSKGFDLGLDYETRNGLLISATYFSQKIEDEIFFDLSGFSGYLQSTGTTKSKGVELSANVPVATQWTISTNYTYNDTEDRDGEQRLRRPKHLANIGIRFTSEDNRLRSMLNVRTSKDSVDEIFGVGRVDLDDYTVVDMSVVYEINETIKVNASVFNLLDEDYQEITGFNTAGTAASVGVTFSL